MEYTKGPYCNNCGNVGHLYRNCLHPILSYGIILYKEVSENEYELLMVERKNSISYIEFLRGKYRDIHNIEYIELLCSRFSSEEKIKILQHSFDELWKDLWIHVETINPRIKKEYEKSKQMFSILQDGYVSDKQEYSLHSFIENVSTTYQHNEWEIPKGRRSNRETNRNCAIREFEEETNISRDKYQLFVHNNECYLLSLQTTYNSTTNAFHDQGQPVEIDIALTFQEVKALTREELYEAAEISEEEGAE